MRRLLPAEAESTLLQCVSWGEARRPTTTLDLFPVLTEPLGKHSFSESGAKSYVDFNVMYAKAADCLQYHVLSVSSLQHLETVLEKAKSLPPLDKQLFLAVEKLKDEMWCSGGVPNPYFLQATGLRGLKRKAATMLKRTMVRASRRPIPSPWTTV